MSDTGHKELTVTEGKNIVEWLRPTIEDEARYFGVPVPTDEQIAVVVSSMRMHTLITRAAGYDQSELGKPDEVTKYWPIESSIGRFFRDAARVVLDRIDLSKRL